MNEHDKETVSRFIKERCDCGMHIVGSTTVWNAFQEWLKTIPHYENYWTQTRFARTLSGLGHVKVTVRYELMRTGLRLKKVAINKEG